MAPRKNAAAENAAVNAAEASESETPTTTSEAAKNVAAFDSGANPTTSDTTGPDSGEVEVVVLPKRSLKHNGKKHRQHAKLNLPAEEAERLEKMGFVVSYAKARAEALAAEGVTVSVNDGVRIREA